MVNKRHVYDMIYTPSSGVDQYLFLGHVNMIPRVAHIATFLSRRIKEYLRFFHRYTLLNSSSSGYYILDKLTEEKAKTILPLAKGMRKSLQKSARITGRLNV